MTEIILASQSPRRHKILTEMGVNFKVTPSEYDEQLDETRDAREVAKELALGKALWVAERHPDAIVIGSDSIVAFDDGRQLAKPADVDEARRMLIELSKNVSFVTTGVAIVCINRQIQLVDEDSAYAYSYPDSPEISRLREEYLATNDWVDKAGGYGIQSGAAPLLEKIVGHYDTIVGMPSRLLASMLAEVGVKAKPIDETPPVPQEFST